MTSPSFRSNPDNLQNMEDNMPKALENKLKAEARKKGLTGKRFNAYVYGTLEKTGWKPGKKKGNKNG